MLELGLIAAILVAAVAGIWVVLGQQQSSPTGSGATSRAQPSDTRLCSALDDFDSHRRGLRAYLNDIETEGAEVLRDRHDDLLEAMLATARTLFGTSTNESEFSALELAIGDWMQEVDGAMTMIDSAFRTGDRGYLGDAGEYLNRATIAEATIDRQRGAAAC
ncbi:MAG: hypothetical protein K5799_15020 [Erythrobacter sp.]|nr:hypothetical protein [Erythrobacter sp.]